MVLLHSLAPSTMDLNNGDYGGLVQRRRRQLRDNNSYIINYTNSVLFFRRTLLMREALILLNIIVSNQQYSAIVLRILTQRRDMASKTIDIVSRLSRENQINGRMILRQKKKEKGETEMMRMKRRKMLKGKHKSMSKKRKSHELISGLMLKSKLVGNVF
ncbi:uncharacterized protein [Euphorbia lathyris]|uniref:uncharacterized protein isoform X6 n=1 Tax=Euphorbia lathyris TaxID=212925 RepID=UPI003313EDBD